MFLWLILWELITNQIHHLCQVKILLFFQNPWGFEVLPWPPSLPFHTHSPSASLWKFLLVTVHKNWQLFQSSTPLASPSWSLHLSSGAVELQHALLTIAVNLGAAPPCGCIILTQSLENVIVHASEKCDKCSSYRFLKLFSASANCWLTFVQPMGERGR